MVVTTVRAPAKAQREITDMDKKRATKKGGHDERPI
jgi:hypothetical protein